MEDRPLNAIEDSARAAPDAAVRPRTARWFLAAAGLVAVVDIPIAFSLTHHLPSFLVFSALAFALAGLTVDVAIGAQTGGRPGWPAIGRLLGSDGWCSLAVGILFMAFYGATIAPPTPYNEHARLAWALLHGHVWVNAPTYMEHVVVDGRSYVVHPGFDGILMIPAVAIWGRAANQTAMAVILGAISLGLAWRLLGRLEIGTTTKIWLVAFFGIGTTFWYEATLGASWDFALVASVPFTLAALCEVFGEARPLWVGLWAALAAMARYDLVMAWPAYVLMLAVRGRRWRELSWMLPGFALAAAVYVGYNEARFGTVNDIARWLFYNQDKYRFQRPGGPMALGHLPFNLYTLLFMAPGYNNKFPWIHPEFMGQALMLTSPAFVLAFRPSFLKAQAALVLMAALLTSGPSLLWYSNGFAQLGTRHCVQIYPFLLALMAMGVGKGAKPDQLTRILIVVSMVFVTFFFWQVRWYGFGG